MNGGGAGGWNGEIAVFAELGFGGKVLDGFFGVEVGTLGVRTSIVQDSFTECNVTVLSKYVVDEDVLTTSSVVFEGVIEGISSNLDPRNSPEQ